MKLYWWKVRYFFKRLWQSFLRLFQQKPYSIKPTGTVSLVTSHSQGIHPVHQPKYFRRFKMECNIDKHELEFRHLSEDERKSLNSILKDYKKKHEQDLNIRLVSKKEHARA